MSKLLFIFLGGSKGGVDTSIKVNKLYYIAYKELYKFVNIAEDDLLALFKLAL